MEEKTELNDIILNQGNNGNGSKKILLAVASLAIILIIIIVIMNSIQSDNAHQLPEPVLPKEPQIAVKKIIEEDPLFQPVEVIEEPSGNDNLDKIAQKLKEESLKEEPSDTVIIPSDEVVVVEEPKPVTKPKKPEVQKTLVAPKPKVSFSKEAIKGKHYVQVGSFSQYEPNKRFLSSITQNGYSYAYHKTQGITKVLIGPFDTKADAQKALLGIRKSVEKGAFIVKV
jgi:DedD protein